MGPEQSVGGWMGLVRTFATGCTQVNKANLKEIAMKRFKKLMIVQIYHFMNNLWSFIEVYVVFVPNLCGEKSVRRKYV